MDNNPNPSGAPQASYPYPPAKPQIPGKGQGIVGLVMSIIGVLQSFGLIWVMLSVFILSLLDASSYSFTGPASVAGILLMMIYVVIILIFTLIGLIFSIRARAKGYKNGISTAGLILSIIALAITAVILIVYFVVGAIVV